MNLITKKELKQKKFEQWDVFCIDKTLQSKCSQHSKSYKTFFFSFVQLSGNKKE